MVMESAMSVHSRGRFLADSCFFLHVASRFERHPNGKFKSTAHVAKSTIKRVGSCCTSSIARGSSAILDLASLSLGEVGASIQDASIRNLNSSVILCLVDSLLVEISS